MKQGAEPPGSPPRDASPPRDGPDAARLARLEQRVASLERTVAALEARVAALAPPPPGAASSAGTSRAPRAASVLVVDDQETNRRLAERALRRAGYEVDSVCGGREAVEALRARAYDVVLTDIQMPDLDGFETAQAIRALGGPAARLPLVSLSANTPEELGERYRSADFAAHVGKPFERRELVATVEGLLRGVDGPLEPQTLERLAEDVGDAFDELLDELVGSTRQLLDALPAEVAAGHGDVVRRHAHDLKSLAATVGAPVLRDAAEALERSEAGDAARLARRVGETGSSALRALERWRTERGA